MFSIIILIYVIIIMRGYNMKKIKNKITNIYKKITKKIKRNRNKFSFKETITFMLITFLFGIIIDNIIIGIDKFF